ncbi:Putative flippase GtrA (transmembrane translocase of bactoprenol-linked glucose) [Actinomyces denticolens]|uniref:Flippase GtrA (Transmembrane translocase of bactoprenol-linked glucose) n=1 Tax=Actinomyces denticolens TaxID=52767 RepID=A0ABY1IFV2_9ACTO|nr:GtrA family protein [Actinomyces denticolens]SHJ10778.1 Putative flippase GtrA (transmembrane translocase of bactoprenol-linked glucose) [Actinomyces denticolens]
MPSTTPETAVEAVLLTGAMSAARESAAPLSAPAAPGDGPAPAARASRAPERFARFTGAVHRVIPTRLRRLIPETFIGYAVINGSAFLLDIACLSVFYNHLHWWYSLAVTMGYTIAGVYSLLLNRWLNFQSHEHLALQGGRYFIGLISQYVIFILGLSSLLHWFGVNALVARVVSACCEGLYLYVFVRLWVFRDSARDRAPASA